MEEYSHDPMLYKMDNKRNKDTDNSIKKVDWFRKCTNQFMAAYGQHSRNLDSCMYDYVKWSYCTYVENNLHRQTRRSKQCCWIHTPQNRLGNLFSFFFLSQMSDWFRVKVNVEPRKTLEWKIWFINEEKSSKITVEHL